MSATKPVWIFGYGSLMWRPDFPYKSSKAATLHGWARRFWQYSPDHRGVPDYPGLVVTLVSEARAMCHGQAFLPAPAYWDEIIEALDHREQNGYDLLEVEVEFDDGSVAAGVTYIAGPDNPSFSGPLSELEIVERIATSSGPSGTNREYLESLARCLADAGRSDDHVRALSTALAEYMCERVRG